jgi:hypothetical protein
MAEIDPPIFDWHHAGGDNVVDLEVWTIQHELKAHLGAIAILAARWNARTGGRFNVTVDLQGLTPEIPPEAVA